MLHCRRLQRRRCCGAVALSLRHPFAAVGLLSSPKGTADGPLNRREPKTPHSRHSLQPYETTREKNYFTPRGGSIFLYSSVVRCRQQTKTSRFNRIPLLSRRSVDYTRDAVPSEFTSKDQDDGAERMNHGHENFVAATRHQGTPTRPPPRPFHSTRAEPLPPWFPNFLRNEREKWQGELGPLNDFVDQDFVGDVGTDESTSEIDELLQDLPPTPFDWDNRTHQDALDDFFLEDVREYRWQRVAQGIVDCVPVQ